MPTREEAKAQRREDIVNAAMRLMYTRGDSGFSMRALADAAGVSIATPYNLFGSKQAIMLAVLDTGMALYEQRLGKLQADELEIFFEAVSLATELYAEAPKFHQAVLFSAYGDGGRDYRAVFGDPRFLFWKALVERARNAGFLEIDVDPSALALALSQQFFICILEWAYGEIGLAELEQRVHYTFALLLHGAATSSGSRRLKPRIKLLQKNLTDRWSVSDPRKSVAASQ
ncbi:MAG: TetR/AcrR family transcriptional regulator [Gammaproteobacteria bacterium]|nr:TetR/AcrR family transcriptional regulator [Gammaproteobacteria bacterium]